MYIFEGIDRIGKSTLAKNFAEYLGAYYTYEPFADTEDEKTLRNMALTKDINRISREYLLLANRAMGYERLEPYVEKGEVVTDRSFISGMVYARMEGWTFQNWWRLYRPLLNEWGLRGKPIVIMCTNKKILIKKDCEDRYDSKPERFHREVEILFRRALEFLETEFGRRIRYTQFEIKFEESPEENLARLKKHLVEGDNGKI